MKIGILTLPLHTNYGGILQAYALQTVLEQMGNEVHVINREYHVDSSKKTVKGKIWELLENHYYFYNTRKFIQKKIHRTSKVISNDQLNNCLRLYNFDAIIVGSDQVWRPEYSPNIYNYFLDFAEAYHVKRIAYAASFGVGYWQFSETEALLCSKLAQKFDAVSVREKSGIGLCEDYLGVKAEFVLDPTFLLNIEMYQSLASQYINTKDINGELFCYILDMTTIKSEIIKCITEDMGMKSSIYSPHTRMVIWPLEKWLRAFMDARMIITDSFHGMVFCIIFNKPFWVIGNESRGVTRFHSLLSALGLDNRFINEYNAKKLSQSPIDWNTINNRIERMRNHSLNFLTKALN